MYVKINSYLFLVFNILIAFAAVLVHKNLITLQHTYCHNFFSDALAI